MLITQLRQAPLLFKNTVSLRRPRLAASKFLPILQSATVLIFAPVVVVIRTIGTGTVRLCLLAAEYFLALLLSTSLLPDLTLLHLLLPALLLLILLNAFPILFPTSLLFQTLLFLALLNALAVLFPTLLLFRALLFLVLLNTLAVLLPTLLLLRTLLFLPLLRALAHFLRAFISLVLLRGAARFTFLCSLLLLSLTGLVPLFLLLLLRSAAGSLFSLSLIALLLILLTSFLSAAAAPLRASQIGNSKGYRQRKDPRGCEGSIVYFH
ncbi:MAG TPA: hypothetical protein VJU84_02875 [Pyrinomonadaceae bacterium]|nr:hypothetical protein [Pyrinomonadaceae bacterium]